EDPLGAEGLVDDAFRGVVAGEAAHVAGVAAVAGQRAVDAPAAHRVQLVPDQLAAWRGVRQVTLDVLAVEAHEVDAQVAEYRRVRLDAGDLVLVVVGGERAGQRAGVAEVGHVAAHEIHAARARVAGVGEVVDAAVVEVGDAVGGKIADHRGRGGGDRAGQCDAVVDVDLV